MFEAGSCTLVSEAVLKQSALSPRRFAFATCLPGKTAPRGRRRRESSPFQWQVGSKSDAEEGSDQCDHEENGGEP